MRTSLLIFYLFARSQKNAKGAQGIVLNLGRKDVPNPSSRLGCHRQDRCYKALSSDYWVLLMGQKWGKPCTISCQSMPMHTLMLEASKALKSQFSGAWAPFYVATQAQSGCAFIAFARSRRRLLGTLHSWREVLLPGRHMAFHKLLDLEGDEGGSLGLLIPSRLYGSL